jgi:prepilin-type processing-associated H-X9-DG protein/prepilin-type N-terminal cleavage/methylation domain-containing protein
MIKYPQAAHNLLVTQPGDSGRNVRPNPCPVLGKSRSPGATERKITRRPTPTKMAGFTLVELLVVILIIASLSAIAFPFIRASINKGQTVRCMENLRDLGVRITGEAVDKGHYPATQNGVPLWQLVAGWSGGNWQDLAWCCPARSIKTGARNSPFTPAYSANERVFPTEGLRLGAVQRPDQVIALIDAGQRTPSGWAFHQMMVKGATNPANANTPLQGKPITSPNTDIASGGACVRYRHQGNANTLFLDGHVEARKMGSILEKNISISY